MAETLPFYAWLAQQLVLYPSSPRAFRFGALGRLRGEPRPQVPSSPSLMLAAEAAGWGAMDGWLKAGGGILDAPDAAADVWVCAVPGPVGSFQGREIQTFRGQVWGPVDRPLYTCGHAHPQPGKAVACAEGWAARNLGLGREEGEPC